MSTSGATHSAAPAPRDAALAPERAELAPEDRSRADFYALLSRLFYAGPDRALLAALAAAPPLGAEDANTALAQSWNSLVAAADAADAESAAAEYDSVFVGTGKAEITPYASHYLAHSAQDNVLVRLRAELDALGLERWHGAAEYEDHISALCEVMRHLIFFTDDVAVQKQKSFFLAYVILSYPGFCDAVAASPNAGFYKHVARFAKAFLDLESESFEMT